MQNASYLANIAFAGISGFIGGESISNGFAERMQDGFGVFSAVVGPYVFDFPFLGVLGGATPHPEALTDWLGVLGFLIGIAVGAKHLLSKKPSHAELATKEELGSYVRQSQFNEFKTEVRGDMAEIKALIGGAVSKVEDFAEKSYQARKSIHRDVNRVDKQLTECKTRQEEQEKQINKLENRG
ncbi:hypothetical protein [Rubritalea sp.]|uniref:hypothetical protein n=1 Tax=Rubritalea sp. TaxID=2109375 RepID=UPI003EF9DBB8